MSRDYRALVCMTTCDRPESLRRYLPHFARLCRRDRRFSLIVALDGGEPGTRRFCDEWNVTLLHSQEPEGVGMSKNRVLTSFPDFDYYFFLDDDVEVVDDRVFEAHVELSGSGGIHHFSLFARGGVRKPTGESIVAGRRIVHGLFGGGQFNFYTGDGLRAVGGWHPRFAEYRRWGHTEHSYRFWRSGLTPAPFNVAEDLADACVWHSPPATTRPRGVPVDDDQIPLVERELIEQELRHVPVQTGVSYSVNAAPLGGCDALAATLDGGERYPLVTGRERRRCRSSYELWRLGIASGAAERVSALSRAWWYWPGNPALRHAVKGWLRS